MSNTYDSGFLTLKKQHAVKFKQDHNCEEVVVGDVDKTNVCSLGGNNL